MLNVELVEGVDLLWKCPVSLSKCKVYFGESECESITSAAVLATS